MPIGAPLERKLHRQLHLTWVADTLAQEAVKVEQPWRGQRIDFVRVIEGFEHLDRRNQPVALAEFERTRQPPIEREVSIVLAQRVAVGCGSNGWCYWLRRTRLYPRRELKSPGYLRVHVEIKLVANVSIRKSIIET